MTDVRGIRSAVARVDGEAVRVDPGTPHATHRRGLQLVLGAERSNAANRPLALSLNLDVIGTTQLALVPAAEETQWTLKADWPHPSFGGRFLPNTRNVTDQGFAAQWAVSTLASTAATDALEDGVICPSQAADSDGGAYAQTQAANGESHPCLDTLAVTLLDPVSPYVLSDRATKYGVMFIVLTFGFVALGEVLQRRRVHPVQYTLVGLALAIFFLLLLSLSEHIAFAWAYVIASAACVALLGFYGRFMLDSWRGGATMGAGVALLYAALWALLQLEQTALVIGAVLLFVALAAVMVLTRRIDWYAWFAALQVGSPARATAEQGVGGHAMHNVRGNPSPEGSS
jgi:inner membrane protein